MYSNLLILFSIVISFYPTDLQGQFSFISIQDTIIITDSNSVIFHASDIDTNNYIYKTLISADQLTIVDSICGDLTRISLAIDNENRKRTEFMKKKIGGYLLEHEEYFGKYAFQIYPVINDKGEAFYLTVILKKSYYKEWKKEPIFINTGFNNYYIFGLVPI